MSQSIPTQGKRTFLADFSAGQFLVTVLAAIAASIIAAALSVWYTQGQTLTRLSVVEKAQEGAVTREVLDERWKLVERIDKNVEKLRDLLLEQQARGKR
jgi:predicted AlkP superfamily phosphohydrolase/phosphomutase